MKKVRLIVKNNTQGAGTEIGTAEIDELPNGDKMVKATITDPEIASLLGGSELKGIVPAGPSGSFDIPDNAA